MPINEELHAEIAFFNANAEMLATKYRDQYVIIRGGAVVGAFGTIRAALDAGYTEFGNAPFLVRQCGRPPREAHFTRTI